jgi:hypothetical protein
VIFVSVDVGIILRPAGSLFRLAAQFLGYAAAQNHGGIDQHHQAI